MDSPKSTAALRLAMSLYALALLLFTSHAIASQPNIYVEPNKKYVSSLKMKYASRLIYRDSKAARVVESFNIDCRSRDGRYVPLVNILYAKLATVDSPKAWQVTFVDIRGERVRITDDVVTANGKTIVSQVWGEINEWGELVLSSVRSEALINTCWGSYGPILAGGQPTTNTTTNRKNAEPEPSRSKTLVYEPRNFEAKARTNPVGACAWKIAVAGQSVHPSIEDLSQKDKYCSKLSSEEMSKAESEASEILHGLQ